MKYYNLIERLKLLTSGDICISYNHTNLREILGYYLYDNQTKIFIWTKYGKKVYDDFLYNLDATLLNFGEEFLRIKYPQDCEIEILKEEYFYILNGNILKKIFFQKNNRI